MLFNKSVTLNQILTLEKIFQFQWFLFFDANDITYFRKLLKIWDLVEEVHY